MTRKLVDIHRAPQGVAAEAIGITPRMLRDLPAAPRNADKSYDIPLLVAWQIARKQADFERDSGGTGDEKNPELARLRRANAQIAEEKLKEILGQTVATEDVRVEVIRAADAVKRRLLSLPGSMAARVQGLPVEQCAQALEVEVRDALRELCEVLNVDNGADPRNDAVA